MDKDTLLTEIKELRAEHQRIRADVISLTGMLDGGAECVDPALLQSTIDYVRAHHAREERLLFPWLAQQKFLSHGGPRCTHFMGQRMMGLSESENWRQRAPVMYHRPAFVPGESPLDIPLQEHQVGEFLASRLEALAGDRRDPAFATHLRGWLRLVEQHRSKEDECLFVLVEQHLTGS